MLKCSKASGCSSVFTWQSTQTVWQIVDFGNGHLAIRKKNVNNQIQVGAQSRHCLPKCLAYIHSQSSAKLWATRICCARRHPRGIRSSGGLGIRLFVPRANMHCLRWAFIELIDVVLVLVLISVGILQVWQMMFEKKKRTEWWFNRRWTNGRCWAASTLSPIKWSGPMFYGSSARTITSINSWWKAWVDNIFLETFCDLYVHSN